MKYFKVVAKGGHVGKSFYYRAVYFVSAENGREAALKVRKFPRVKHDRKDAIISVEKISFDEYKKGCSEEYRKPWHCCANVQEQSAFWNEIQDDVFEESCLDKNIYKKKRTIHSVRNEDPFYYELKHYHGTI